MKRAAINLLFILSLLYGYGCNKADIKPSSPPDEAPTGSIFVIPDNEGGWEIYSAGKELLLEFTRENTDSLSLETLEYIYNTLKENSTSPDEENKGNILLTSVNITLQK